MASMSVPAPVGGWNARDSLDAMDPLDAISLVNLFPGQSSVESRAGAEEFSTGFGGAVETISTYRSGTVEQMIVGANNQLWRVTLSNGSKTSLSSGYSSDRWQTLNFNGKLILCNGSDNPVEYDGTSTSNVTYSGGVSPSDIVGVTSYKGRAFYWENNSANFWYASAGSYAGPLSEFVLDTIVQTGGDIIECMTWTRDAGDGQDDLFVIVFNTGEVLVYQGDDPGSSTDWSMIGRYSIGAPITPRGSTQLAADRVVITKDGYVPLSIALQQARVSELNNISGKIIKAAKSAATKYANNYGWEVIHYPKESMLIVNVPVDPETTAAESTYEQHVMNTNTGAWCKFTGWKAITFGVAGDQLYFGDADGKVFKAYTSTEDDGAFIQTECVPAFNPLSGASIQKQLTLCTVVSDYYSPNYLDIEGLSDFNVPRAGTFRTPPDGSQAEWDASSWDEDFWAGDGSNEPVRSETFSVAAFGYMLSVRLRFQSKIQRVRLYSLKYQFKNGRSV